MRIGVAAAVVAAAIGCQQPTIDRLPLTACYIDGLSEQAACGILEVAEDPASPNGRRIPIHVAILEASGAERVADPLFVFAGGPGQGARSYAGGFDRTFRKIRRARDLVFIDLRGTGASHPLTCNIHNQSTTALPTQDDVEQCLRQQAADVRFYTHVHALADVDAVRDALGYQRINLWGGSYGTRAALLYTLKFPHRVRSVTLDGAVPLAQTFPSSIGADAHDALEQLLTRCDHDATCAAAFPHLRQEVDTLRKGPKGRDVASAIRVLLYVPRYAALLPYALHAAFQGDWAPLEAVLDEIRLSTVDTMAVGMTLSVLCTEDVPRITPAGNNANDWLGGPEIEWWMTACSKWPRHAVPDIYNTTHAPLDVPALILSGGHDPVAPKRWGERMAGHFTSARHVIVPSAAHNTSFSGCVPDLVARFIERDTAVDLATDCLTRIPHAPFVTSAYGPQP